MRLELESLHMSLKEFIDHVIASDESVELTRGNEVILKFEKAGTKKKVVRNARSPVESTRQRIAVDSAAKKLTVPRRVEKKITMDASAESRREQARTRLLYLTGLIREETAKHYKNQREVQRDVDAAVREVRKKYASRPS
ncbi:MAG: hypothetical protein WCT04_22125 [Planctomycetota bacterium]